MTNHIKDISVKNVRVDPVQADIEVTVYLETLQPNTQVRGKIVGPFCALASTVEVAYALREQKRDTATSKISLRVIIPEPSLWDEESPFLYRLILELWQDGQRCDEKSLIYAIRK